MDHAKTLHPPPVDSLIVALSRDNLWNQIFRSAANSIGMADRFGKQIMIEGQFESYMRERLDNDEFTLSGRKPRDENEIESPIKMDEGKASPNSAEMGPMAT